MNDYENPLTPFPKEEYIEKYGVHHWNLKNGKTLTAISSPNWTDFITNLNLITPNDELIVSPEIITCTETKSDIVSENKTLIEERIGQVKKLSASHPNTTLVLGTPIFSGEGKPKNGALIIKDGTIVGQTAKRSGAIDWEKNNFMFDPEEEPFLIPETDLGILICSDLAMMTIYLRPNKKIEDLNYVLTRSGHKNLVGFNPQFVHPKTKTLIVPSCWGIGGNNNLGGKTPTDQYYRTELRNTSFDVLRHAKQIQQIVVIDRAPTSNNAQEFITTKPINALFTAKI